MRFDIMPFASPHGAHTKVDAVRLGGGSTYNTAGTSFREGEVLLIDGAAGDVNVCADGARSLSSLVVIAAASSEAIIRGARATSGASTFNLMVPVYSMQPDQEFITRYAVNNNDTLVAVSTLFVGDQVALWRDNVAVGTGDYGVNGRFAIDTNGTGATITRILDSRKRDVGLTGGTGVYAVFRIN